MIVVVVEKMLGEWHAMKQLNGKKIIEPEKNCGIFSSLHNKYNRTAHWHWKIGTNFFFALEKSKSIERKEEKSIGKKHFEKL